MTYSQPSLLVWADHVQPGDIVACQFPHGEDQARGKSRPCLVLAVQNLANGIYVTLAYGTTATSPANRGLELPLSDYTDWPVASLRRPTRFVLARRLTVPSTDRRFDLGASNDPTIGRLPDHALARLTQLTRFLGPTVTDDRHHGRSARCSRGKSRDPRGSVITERHEITAPARSSRRDRNKPNITIIVEHRRKRVLRPTPSAA